MRTNVPRSTFTLADRSKACVRCIALGRLHPRPARKTPSRQQSYCTICNTEVNRERRRGKVQTLVTPEELELIRELRQAQPRGRHHQAAS